MNDKKETVDDLRDYNKGEAEKKAIELYNNLKNELFPNKYLKLKEMYQIETQDFDFSFVANHKNKISNLDEIVENSIIKKEEEREKEKKETTRKAFKLENIIEQFAVKECNNNEQKFDISCIGVFFDFEIPTVKGGKRNIDLVSYNEKDSILRIIELKQKENDNDYFKAIVELLDYYIRAKGYDLTSCELRKHPYLKNKKINAIRMAILAHSESQIVIDFKENNYPNIKKLLEFFEIEFYEYTARKHNIIKEEIIIDSINKLK